MLRISTNDKAQSGYRVCGGWLGEKGSSRVDRRDFFSERGKAERRRCGAGERERERER